MTPSTGADGDRQHGSQQDDLCVARVPLFGALDVGQQRDVARVARSTPLQRGELVYTAGSDHAQLMVVHSGSLKISRTGADGREQILRVLGPGEFFGESALLTGVRPDHFATALTDGSMCVIRHSDLAPLIRTHPAIGFTMLEIVSTRLTEAENRLQALLSADVTARVADYLLALPARTDPEGVAVELPLSKKDIASLLDTTPESLSRQLRKLSDSGILAMDGPRRLRITDVDALIGLAAPR